jgi:hypothetical protein
MKESFTAEVAEAAEKSVFLAVIPAKAGIQSRCSPA